MIPPALNRVVKTCLAKDPEDRFQTAHDAKLQLQWIAEGGSQAGLPAPVVARRKNREKLAWAVAAAALVAAGLATVGYLRRAPAPRSRISATLAPPEKVELDVSGANCGSLTVSPDGRLATFPAKDADGKMVLWLRSLGEPGAKPIAGTQGATFPFWSPDSRFLAFFADGKLQKVDTTGAPPLPICDAPNGRSGSWNREGVILFSPDSTTGIMHVSSGGGTPKPATTLDTASRRDDSPLGDVPSRRATLSLHGRFALGRFEERVERDLRRRARLEREDARSPGTLERRVRVGVSALHARAHPARAALRSGLRGAWSGKPSRSPRASSTTRPTSTASSRRPPTASSSTLSARSGSVAGRLTWLDRAGKQIGEPLGEPAEYSSLALSPEGKRIAAGINDPATGASSIWLFDGRGVRSRFTFGDPSDAPLWSRDGERLAFLRVNKQALADIHVKPAGGSGEEISVFHTDRPASPDDWSPDGKYLLVDLLSRNNPTKGDVWLVPVSGSEKPRPLLASEFNERSAMLLAGRQVGQPTFRMNRAARSCTSSRSRDRGRSIRSPRTGPRAGRSSKEGSEIIYGTLDNEPVSVDVKTGPSGLEVGPPTVLFKLPPVSTRHPFTRRGEISGRPAAAGSRGVSHRARGELDGGPREEVGMTERRRR